MNVVAIGANPDDVEIGVGGTLARHVKEGDKVYILHMVNTGYDDPITKRIWRTDDETREYARKAAKIIGAELHTLNFKDRQVPFDERSIIIVDRFLRKHSIHVVYTHWDGDSHQDHINTHKTVMAAARYIGNICLFEQIPLPRANVVSYEPKYYVDITDFMQIKLNAVKIYESETRKYPGLLEGVKALARYRGTQCSRKYAEAFEVVKEVR
jgi:LmbE family N-acetylglucosaminyl deacetylase